MKISNVQVYGLYQSIIRSKMPMKSGEPESIQTILHPEIMEYIEKTSNLGKCDLATGHDNFLNGIIVQFDLQYPQYFSMQMQRYHFLDFVSSQSKMHTITKREDIKEFCNEWVDSDVINIVNKYIYWYNNFEDEIERLRSLNSGNILEKKIHLRDNDGNIHSYDKKELFMKIISNLPMGFELWAGMTTNYRQLKTIYYQRRHHKLPEWQEFCNWITTLPMFKDLVLGK